MRLSWSDPAQRLYEAGVDRGVFYPAVGPGVAWNGLISLTENDDNKTQMVLYVDGDRHISNIQIGSYSATLSAITYPVEFEEYEGYANDFITGQRRKSFSLSYRTLIGDPVEGTDFAYKIHLVYNVLADPSGNEFTSLNVDTDYLTLEWELSTTPVPILGLHPSAHLIIDSRTVNVDVLTILEEWLYGTAGTTPRMPSMTEIFALFESYAIFRVVDNGDGTATISGPDDAVYPLGHDDLWVLDYISVNQIEENLYFVTSY